MKKILAIILSAVIFICPLTVAAVAAENDKKVYPLVLLQGYAGPSLVNQDTGEKVWGLDFDKLRDNILNNYAKDLADGAFQYAQGNADKLVDTIGTIFNETLDPIACNEDGTSKYNLDCFPKGAAATRVSTLIANGQSEYIGEPPIINGFIDELKSEGIENAEDYIFIFTDDWRKGQYDYAKDIDAYITEVKELTGSDKVDIYGLSHGGQCGASYLYYFGEKADVHKACLNVPAIGGTSMVGDPMLGNDITLDFPTILEFVEVGNRSEDEWEWILQYLSTLTGGYQNLNKLVNLVAQKYIINFIDKITSLWDFIPLDVYDEVKTRLVSDGYIDLVKAAPLIAKSDEFHYNAMANMREGLKKAQAAGVEIAIMTNTGRNGVTGTYKNSDYIIDAHTSSGAYCAVFGEQLAKDYICAGTSCSDPTHYHISPDRDIDATCAYLPENTWFIKGQFHGQSNWDSYTRNFILEFLFGDSITDIYSSPAYPQFEIAQNPADGLYMRFDNTNSGFHSSKDTSVIFKNLSEKYSIDILTISAKGFNFTPKYYAINDIAAGETYILPVAEHYIPSNLSPVTVTVKYRLNSTPSVEKEKTFVFTPMQNEDIATYKFLNDAAKLNTSSPMVTETTTAAATTDQGSVETIETAVSADFSTNKTASIPKTGTAKRGLAISSLAVLTAAAAAVIAVKSKKEYE